MVGVRGLEPPASWSRTKRSTKLSHTPDDFHIINESSIFVNTKKRENSEILS